MTAPNIFINLQKMNTDILSLVHGASFRNRAVIERSHRCGCFCCCSMFEAASVDEWVDNGETALCPRCGVDAVIGDASGFGLSEDLLKKMNGRFF